MPRALQYLSPKMQLQDAELLSDSVLLVASALLLMHSLYFCRADIQASSTAAAIGPASRPSRAIMLIGCFVPQPPFTLAPFSFCMNINQGRLAMRMVRGCDWSGTLCL
ncbi:hypothetical protein PoB_001390700 [Plakobranchus ocellatus]|uniref:Uncharacterized protein n=1 Tax=Plakobranchus ocellatus TaxID=259542 RepID=A0AAV3YYK5_9GAST|nr:hypothetical protein PoB_001390700 [Plakobranchus ocellatus]